MQYAAAPLLNNIQPKYTQYNVKTWEKPGDNMKNHVKYEKPGKNSTSVWCVQATPTCQSFYYMLKIHTNTNNNYLGEK